MESLVNLWYNLIGCIISAVVSSQGHVINVDHLRYLQSTPSGGCEVRQYGNPHTIYSDWSCKEVEEQIIFAIKSGCKEVS